MMPRILDIGAFNAVREAGLAKLVPTIPRITVGMGTCGRGNGAEEVFHALNEEIQRSGLDVTLTGVGCFGACFQETNESIHHPWQPLMMLRRFRANNASRFLDSLSSVVMLPVLLFCKIDECDHITALVLY